MPSGTDANSSLLRTTDAESRGWKVRTKTDAKSSFMMNNRRKVMVVGGKGESLIKGKKNTHIPKITGTGTKMIGAEFARWAGNRKDR